MRTLSKKQQEVVSKYDITVEETDQGEFVYLVAGVYNQQKGFKTAYAAYCEAITKVFNR